MYVRMRTFDCRHNSRIVNTRHFTLHVLAHNCNVQIFVLIFVSYQLNMRISSEWHANGADELPLWRSTRYLAATAPVQGMQNCI